MVSKELFYGIPMLCLSYKTNETVWLAGPSRPTLRIAALHLIAIHEKGTDTYKWCDFYSHAIIELGRWLGYNLIFFHDNPLGLGGTKLPNGSYNGVMGFIQRKEVDMIMGMMGHAEARMEIADTAGVLGVENHMTLLDSAKNLKNDLTGIFECFSWQIWVLVVFSYLVHVVGNSRLSKNLGSLKSVFYSGLDHFGILLEQDVSGNTIRQYGYRKLPLFIWTTAAFFFCQFFTSDMLANLTNKPQRVIDSIDQVFEDKSIIPLCGPADYNYQNFLRNTSLAPRIQFIKYHEKFSLKIFNRIIKEEKTVLILKESLIQMNLELNPYLPLRQSKMGRGLAFTGFLVDKAMDRVLKTKIQKLMAIFKSSGIWKFWYIKTFLIKSTEARLGMTRAELLDSATKLSTFEVLQVEDIAIAFIMQAFGVLIALIILYLERNKFKKINPWEKLKRHVQKNKINDST